VHEVRIRLIQGGGTLWCAEDDDGFVEKADRLADLCTAILEWAEAKGLAEDLSVRLLTDKVAGPKRQLPLPGSQCLIPITVGYSPAHTRLQLVTSG